MCLNDQYNAIGTTNTNTASGSHVAFPPLLQLHISLSTQSSCYLSGVANSTPHGMRPCLHNAFYGSRNCLCFIKHALPPFQVLWGNFKIFIIIYSPKVLETKYAIYIKKRFHGSATACIRGQIGFLCTSSTTVLLKKNAVLQLSGFQSSEDSYFGLLHYARWVPTFWTILPPSSG